MSARGGGAEKLAMKDDRRRRRKPRGVLLPDTNPRRFVVARRPRLSKLTDYPELDFADYERRLASLSIAPDRQDHGARPMSASPPIAVKHWHRSETPLRAISGLTHRSKFQSS